MTLSGTLPLYNEQGKLDPKNPSTGFQVWWNLAFSKWWSALSRDSPPVPDRSGAVTRLLTAAIPVPNPCTYRLSVTVPSAAPGTYPLILLQMGGGGAASLEPVAFTVTS